ncbi:antitoxin PrlF [Constrictibacter sp. MBR-5]|jgi:AbrB family looped-hinge helix DNA binding protein|uniref:AbrB/MazE/SpoVT family DNA-binding domain-containing protein n=1 Tax=Constrictibacter sp. MBR-5 TaxID=3156467 RepID=UPI003392E295
MVSAVMTSKGQTTIPKAVRDKLRLKPGDRLEFLLQRNGTLVVVPKNVPLSALKGCLPRPERTVTVEEMNEAVVEAAVERVERGLR